MTCTLKRAGVTCSTLLTPGSPDFFLFSSAVATHAVVGGVTSSRPTLASAQHPCGSPPGEQGRPDYEDSQSLRGSPLWVRSWTPQNVTGDVRIWVVLELEVADLGVVQPESMSVCTVLPSENKYR